MSSEYNKFRNNCDSNEMQLAKDKPAIISNSDYENYRSWIFYTGSYGIARVNTWSAVVDREEVAEDNSELRQVDNVVRFQNLPSLNSYMKKMLPNCSLVYATKGGSYKFVQAYDVAGQLISDLLTHMGFKLNELDKDKPNPQKMIKRIKRILRSTKYGYSDNSMTFIIHPDEDKKFDGMVLVSFEHLKRHGIKNVKLWDRFSFTLLDKTVGSYKGHCLAVDMIPDMVMFGKPYSEVTYQGMDNFVQLDPVHISDTVRADIQSIASIWAAGHINQETVMNMMVDGLSMVSDKVMEPIKANDCIGIDTKIVRLGLHEVSVMLPGFVRMKWNSEKEGLLKFDQMRFPIKDAIKAYASPLFYVDYDGTPTLLDGDHLVVENGNLFVPNNMIVEFNKKHGGADFDDAFNLMPLEGRPGWYIVWRSPNTMLEINIYQVEVRS